jgi:hypothetical protein
MLVLFDKRARLSHRLWPTKKRIFEMRISSISSYIPKIRIATPKEAISNLTKLAVPIIVLVAASTVREVIGDPFVDCINACDRNGRDAHELAKLLCYAMCWLITK